MNITEIKFYQLPYNYSSMDRFYRKDDVVDLPEPIRIITEDFTSQLSYINNTFLTSTMNIKGDVNFNYIEITIETGSGDNKITETSYWFVNDNELIRPKYNKLTLRKDIFTSYNLIKNTDNVVGIDEKIKITRKLFNNFKVNEGGKSISYINDRNPHIWNNNEYSKVIPQYKNIKPFTITEVLSPTDRKFLNGNVQLKVPKRIRGRVASLTIPFSLYSANSSNIISKIAKGGNEYNHKIFLPLSPLISLLNEILHMTNFTNPGTQLSHLATINIPYENDEDGLYGATTQIPVVYNSLIPITPEEWFTTHLTTSDVVSSGNNNYEYQKCNYRSSFQARNIIKDRDEWMRIFNEKIVEGDTYTCPWGNTINLRSPEFITVMKHILTGFYLNNVKEIAKNKNLNSVDAYTSWMSDFLMEIGNDSNTVVELSDIFNSIVGEATTLINSNLVGGKWVLNYNPNNEYHQSIKTLSTINQDRYNTSLDKKVNLNISNTLLTDWDKYKYLTPQLFSQSYNYNYIDILGNQLPLDNHKLYQSSNLLVQTWIGTSEQNISYYQGDVDDDGNLLEPRYAQKYSLREPVEFTRNDASIAIQLQKNRTDAKMNETRLSNIRDNTLLQSITDTKINQSNSLTDIDTNLNQQNTTTQTAFNTNTKDIGRLRTAGLNATKNVVGGIVGGSFFNPAKIIGSIVGGIAGAGLSVAEYNINKDIDAEKVAAENARLQLNTDNLNNALNARNETNNRALRMEQNANVVRNNSSASIQRMLIEGDIADIKLTPNQTQNVSTITKMFSIEKGEISFITETLNEYQQKELFYYWNKYGIKNWISLSTTNDWYKEFSLYDFFEGGEWTKYLNGIGIYNIEIINEFNTIMSNGVRLHHQSSVYDNLSQLNLVKSKNDINHNIPNWPKTITDILFNPDIELLYDEVISAQITEESYNEETQALEETLNILTTTISECEDITPNQPNPIISSGNLSVYVSRVARANANVERINVEIAQITRSLNITQEILDDCQGSNRPIYCDIPSIMLDWRRRRDRYTTELNSLQSELSTAQSELERLEEELNNLRASN